MHPSTQQNEPKNAAPIDHTGGVPGVGEAYRLFEQHSYVQNNAHPVCVILPYLSTQQTSKTA